MATDIDLWAIKERVVDILDSNSTLFDATGASRKVRKIDAGAPRMQNSLAKETTLPHIWVTNETNIDNVVVSGGTDISTNDINGLIHVIRLKVILMTDRKDGFKSEEQLDDFVKLINESITENSILELPAGGSPLVDDCVIERVRELDPVLIGTHRMGRIITLKVTVSTDEANKGIFGGQTSVSLAAVTYKLKRLWNLTLDHPIEREANSDRPDFFFGRENDSFSITIEAQTDSLATLAGHVDEAATGDITPIAVVITMPPANNTGESDITASFSASFYHAEIGHPTRDGRVLIRLDGVLTTVVTWA